jgi:hypothetical protein
MIINDDYMVYNSDLHRYHLTIKYCSDVLGLDIEERVKSQGAPNANSVIESRLRLISSEIYAYLYAHNNARTIQWIIAESKNARDIIQEALGAQVLYVFTNGDLGFVADKKDNESVICPQAKAILDNTEVIETGCTLTYCGSYRFTAPSYEKGRF